MLFANGLDVADYISHGFSARHVAGLSIWNSIRFTRGGRRSNGFDYTVPNGEHGRWDALEVVGDKSGDLLSSRLIRQPGLIADLLIEFGGHARFIHVIRNPFDCVATIAARGGLTLYEAADEFFRLCEANRIARNMVPTAMWHDLYLEDLIQQPRGVLAHLCRFLDQETTEAYLQACATLVFPSPRRSRAAWPRDLVADVTERLAGFNWLRGYGFEEAHVPQLAARPAAQTSPVPAARYDPQPVLSYYGSGAAGSGR